MSVSIAVVPLQRSLHMFGDPDRSSAYSLSGHVELTLSPDFLGRKSSKILLQSLELVFEGQSEVSSLDIGYSGHRLYSSSTELVRNGPVLLSDDGDEGSGEPCRWNATYNINVPGWLPASSSFGLEGTGVSYRLFATVKYIDVEKRTRDSSQRSSWFLGGIYSAICSGERIATATKRIQIERFFGLPNEEPTPVSTVTYLLKHMPSQYTECEIPSDVISKIQILASVPDYIDMEAKKLTLTLRLRANDLSAEDCQRLQLLGFRVDIQQKDKCRVKPSREYKARFPLPAEESQPPNLPLRWTNQTGFMFEYATGDPNASSSRTFSLLHPSEPGRYDLQSDKYVFATDAEPTDKPTWYTLQTNIPFVKSAAPTLVYEWAGQPILRPSGSSPLLTVRHEVMIHIPLAYDVPGTFKRARETLIFSVPIRFGPTAPIISRPNSDTPSFLSSRPSTSIDPCTVAPFNSANEPILPPYKQFYDHNGDRRIDPTPLPLYSPPGSPVVEHIDASSGEDTHAPSGPIVGSAEPFSPKECNLA
ncbi:hypothetical protein GYMLUDRAFT_245213 [Collybiopsis luxurians FD-317 M1]|uniref:Arrestin-like N-terminal domain-containing protein n=1 Tax=Collybiopsis luxurians FD-317 M1 TaxID=944289 RepID=A0A0D0CAR7_9AGAR|nr:hypothetical protein GYMLUDRAFT_245213 [Collybiopsis luxurians FD-317 M1]